MERCEFVGLVDYPEQIHAVLIFRAKKMILKSPVKCLAQLKS